MTARDEAHEIVHSRLLHCFPELVRGLGGDPGALLAAAGIDPPSGGGRPAISYRQLVALLELAAARLACPDLGMRLAVRQGVAAASGPLGEMMRGARTFGDALALATRLSRFHSPAAVIWLQRSPAAGTVTSGHDILIGDLPHRTQAVEQIVLIGHLVVRDLAGGQVRPRRILFRHQPVAAMAVYRAHFGCEVRFGQRADAMVFAERDLARPVVPPDPCAIRAAVASIDRLDARQPPLTAYVRGIVTHFLGSDLCTRPRVAAELTLHPRTMDRRLIAEGSSFLRIKDEVRRDRLLYYLRTGFDLATISERLGFAEQSVMTRSCRKWFGQPPSTLRVRYLAEDQRAALPSRP